MKDDQLHPSVRMILREILGENPKLYEIEQIHPPKEPVINDIQDQLDVQPKSPDLIEEDDEPDSKLYDPLLDIYNPDQVLESPNLKGRKASTPTHFDLEEKDIESEFPKIDIDKLPLRETFKENYQKFIHEVAEKPRIERFDSFLREFIEKKLRSKISINLQKEGINFTSKYPLNYS